MSQEESDPCYGHSVQDLHISRAFLKASDAVRAEGQKAFDILDDLAAVSVLLVEGSLFMQISTEKL